MDALALPFAITLAVWWIATGAVLFVNGLPKATFGWSMRVAGLVGLAGLAAIVMTRSVETPAGAYAAFFGAIAVWGWNETGFLLGRVTGSRRIACPPDVSQGRRFLLATQSLIHHELVLLGSVAVIAAATWDAPNQTALAAFLTLWIMRLSTKFNIFLGVPNVTVEFLPPHLTYLASYFASRPMNILFPFSVTLSTLVGAWLFHAVASAPPGSHQAVGHALVGTLMLLAVLEHWFLVIPLPFGKLWAWGLASRRLGTAAPVAAPEDRNTTPAPRGPQPKTASKAFA